MNTKEKISALMEIMDDIEIAAKQLESEALIGELQATIHRLNGTIDDLKDTNAGLRLQNKLLRKKRDNAQLELSAVRDEQR